jgi:hypothetical protein
MICIYLESLFGLVKLKTVFFINTLLYLAQDSTSQLLNTFFPIHMRCPSQNVNKVLIQNNHLKQDSLFLNNDQRELVCL